MAELVPFDPSKHKAKDIGLGGLSTEYLVTVEDEEGNPMVVPSIWWDAKGNPVFMGDPESNEPFSDAVRQMALRYEKENKVLFPRFNDYEIADKWAMDRSKSGGAEANGLLASPIEDLNSTGFEPTIE